MSVPLVFASDPQSIQDSRDSWSSASGLGGWMVLRDMSLMIMETMQRYSGWRMW